LAAAISCLANGPDAIAHDGKRGSDTAEIAMLEPAMNTQRDESPR
jgi:hypothetical protein